MKYKLYTNQHQMLYNEIFSLPRNNKNELTIARETDYLVNKYKIIREDFIELGKSKKIDALFTDIFINKKDTVFIFEHIVLRNKKVFILERDNGFDNQDQLIKSKANYLKKVWGNSVDISYFIISDVDVPKSNKKTLGSIINHIESIEGPDKFSSSIKDFITKKHMDLNIKAYFKLKHNINVEEVKVERKSARISIPRNILPNFLKIKTPISFLSSSIMLIYGLSAIISTYSVMKISNFKFAIVVDMIYGWFLYKILSLMEAYIPKRYKYPLLLIILLIFGVFLYKILQFI